MKTRVYALLMCLALLSCVASILSASSVPLTQPTWPQQFSLASGQAAVFGIPVTQPGDIVVDVTWSGSAPSVVLKDLAGATVNAQRQQTQSGVRLNYTVTQADVQKNIVWFVSVTAPGALILKPGAQPVVTGQVSVQSPPADMKQVEQLASQLSGQIRPIVDRITHAPKQVQRPLKSTAIKIADTPASDAMLSEVKASMDRFNKLKSDQVVSILNSLKNGTSSLIKPTNTGIGPKIPGNGHIPPVRPELGPPNITAISPDNGIPGVKVTLTVESLASDDKVHLRLYDNSELPVSEVSRTDTTVIVTVPDYASINSMFSVFYISGQRSTGSVYTSKEFTLNATLPEVLSVSPGSGKAGDAILVKGNGLMAIKQLFLKPYPNQESKFFAGTDPSVSPSMPWVIVAQSDTELMARVPANLEGVASSIDGYVGGYANNSTLFIPYISVRFQIIPTIITRPVYASCSSSSSFTKKEDNDWYISYADQDWNEYMTSPYEWVQAIHHSSFFLGHGGSDTYYMSAPLKNGWTFDHADVKRDAQYGGGNVYLEGTPTGPNGEPGAKVHWAIDAPINFCCYYMWIYAKGPKGVPYK